MLKWSQRLIRRCLTIIMCRMWLLNILTLTILLPPTPLEHPTLQPSKFSTQTLNLTKRTTFTSRKWMCLNCIQMRLLMLKLKMNQIKLAQSDQQMMSWSKICMMKASITTFMRTIKMPLVNGGVWKFSSH